MGTRDIYVRCQTSILRKISWNIGRCYITKLSGITLKYLLNMIFMYEVVIDQYFKQFFNIIFTKRGIHVATSTISILRSSIDICICQLRNNNPSLIS